MATGNYLVDFEAINALFSPQPSYTFPTTQSQIRDNFSDMVPRTVRIPGADGGFDQFGENKAPAEIGLVSVTFEEYADSNEDLQTKRDLVRQMAAWGVGVLTKNCGAEGTRFCYARVNSITMTESPGENGGMKLTATVDFQVAEPYWLVEYSLISLPNVTKTLVTNNTPNVVTLDGIFDTFPEFTFTSNADITGFAISAGADASKAFADCEFQLTGLPASIRSISLLCNSMSVRLISGGSSIDGFQYATWDYANFIKMQAGQPYNVFVFVLTAGTITASRYNYDARF